MTRLPRTIRPALPIAAGVLIYLGERVVVLPQLRWPLTGLGALALLAAVGWTAWAWKQARRQAPETAGAWRIALLPLVLFVLALVLYGTAQWPMRSLVWSHVVDVLMFGWAILGSIGVVWFLFIESALWWQDTATLDAGRVRRASVAGLNLGLLVAIVIALNFAVTQTAWQWDVTYFKTTQASQATRDTVKALQVPVQVALFFPDGDEVGDLAADYFRSLMRSGGGKMTVDRYDADLKPLEAQNYKARGNGVVIFKRDEQIKPIQLGLSLDRARDQLRKFDGEVLADLIDLSRERRTAYVTVGHGERNERSPEGEESETGVSTLESQLRGTAYIIKPLGLAQGLASTVPDDAALVIVIGPTQPFSKAEAQALRAYVDRGGKLLVFLEPRLGPPAHDPLLDMLSGYGVQFENVIQANDRIFARRTFTAADFALLVTNAYGPHPAANTVRRAPDQFPLLLLNAGGLRKGQEAPGMQVRDIVKSMPGTWGDRNGNFHFDGPPEVRQEVSLAMGVGPSQRPPTPANGQPAATQGYGRVVVFADADVASDLLMQNRANAVLLSDTVAWLGGDEAPSGLPTTEEDQRIQHAKGDDWLWFYLPVVGVPLLILLAGVWVTTRRRQNAGGTP